MAGPEVRRTASYSPAFSRVNSVEPENAPVPTLKVKLTSASNCCWLSGTVTPSLTAVADLPASPRSNSIARSRLMPAMNSAGSVPSQ
jgi:hypothetical protein